MTATIRAEDVLARYGGEEFAVICREIEAEGARVLGERLRSAVEQHRFEHAGKVIPVTISVGAAAERKIDRRAGADRRRGRGHVRSQARGPQPRVSAYARDVGPVGPRAQGLRASEPGRATSSRPARARRPACRRTQSPGEHRGEAQLGAHRARAARGDDERCARVPENTGEMPPRNGPPADASGVT